LSTIAPWKGGRLGLVMLSAVGDAVRALPAVNAIKRHAPNTHLTWLLEPGPASLIRGHPAVDKIVEFDKRRGWRAYRDVRNQLEEPFDLVIDLQIALKAGLLTSMLRSPVKLGFDRGRARDLNWLFTNQKIAPHPVQHVQDQYFEFLQALGVPGEPVEYKLGPWPGEPIAIEPVLNQSNSPIATLVIGASHPEKEWVPERWAEVADALADRYGMRTVIATSGSPRERETEAVIMNRAQSKPATVSGLRSLVALIDRSALVISLDTAPLHMAVAQHRPVISLMGYSNPKRVGPYRAFHDLMIDAYGDPGEDYAVSEGHRPGRMRRISAADVIERVERWRANYKPARG
jgi:heptosyltransferase I